MILSMTGFASVTRDVGGTPVAIEIRAVNHRYLEFQLRAPDDVRSTEAQLREALQGQLSRGKVECRVTLGERQKTDSATPDMAALEALAAQEQVVKAMFPHSDGLTVHQVLSWPGVLPTTSIPPAVLAQALVEAFSAGLADLRASRAREGEKLAAFMRERLAAITKLVTEARPLVPAAVAAFQAKLRDRIADAAANVTDERIANEVVLFASRADIEEELSRLSAHVDEVSNVIKKGGAVGKRLDFLMQELNREANTLGSKSVATDLTRIAVELKVLIEQMREQVQNIE
jgi:uncharacterized protein (TIGR00255 family)